MYARTGTVAFSPDKVDGVIAHVKDNVVPMLSSADGFKGFRLLIDREAGTGIGVSFWESEEALAASVELGNKARAGAAEAGSGSDQGAQHYEVVIDAME